jgi:hypothetical protein
MESELTDSHRVEKRRMQSDGLPTTVHGGL